MTTHRVWLRIGLLCLLATASSDRSSAQSEKFPGGAVKFITQLGAGSGTDPAMRIVIDHLGNIWGQQTVLVNQPGAGGALAARAVHSAPPDGRTLYMAIASTFTVLPQTQPNLPFNVDELVPIGFVGEVPMAIAAAPTLPVNSLPELIQYSRRSGGLNVAMVRGGIPHLTTELFRNRSGADLSYVFYPGSAQAMNDVMGGRVPVVVDGLAGPVAGGQLKLLAIASPARVASRPNIPTMSETIPGFVATGWFALVAPPGTPAAIVKKVGEDLNAVITRPDVREKLDALNVSTRPMSPAAADRVHPIRKGAVETGGPANQPRDSITVRLNSPASAWSGK